MNDPRPAIKRPPTTQEAVLAELRRNILRGVRPPGTPIRPDRVAAQFSISRIPIREALRILEGEGLVTYRPHQGYFVAQLAVEDVAEIFRIRELLEDEAIRSAVPNLGSKELQGMRCTIKEMESIANDDVLQLALTNRRFHFTLLEAAKRPRLLHYISLLWNSSDPYLSLFYMSKTEQKRVHAEHRRILRAAEKKDVESLIGEWSVHREHAIRALKKILDGEKDSGGPR